VPAGAPPAPLLTKLTLYVNAPSPPLAVTVITLLVNELNPPEYLVEVLPNVVAPAPTITV
jgi:hypothetical protein